MIEPDSEPTITAIAKILNRCRDAWFEIGGHTDSKGSELLNKNLSQSRADAVLDALLARNLLFGDLTAVGYGESQPIADNATEEGRQKNRRIEFKLREGTPEQAAADAEAARTAAEQAAADLAAARPATPLRRPSDLKIITVDIPQNPTSEATNGQN